MIDPLLEGRYFWSRVDTTVLEKETEPQLCICHRLIQPQYSVLCKEDAHIVMWTE